MMPDQSPDRLVFTEKALFRRWEPGGTVDAESTSPRQPAGLINALRLDKGNRSIR